MAHLRTTLRTNLENGPNIGGGVNPAKGAGQMGLGGKMVTRGARAALGDIGNKANSNFPGKDQAKIAPVKPTRGLQRQKASSSLLQPMQTRRSSGKTKDQDEMDVQPMEVQENVAHVSPQKAMDVDMAEAPKIEDIDADDRENPQLAAEYVNEIYAYLRQLEQKMAVQESYLDYAGPKVTIKPRMRNLLIDWLIEVHGQFSLLQETLYLTVDVVDRFLQVKAGSVATKQLQLVGVTAMFIASKYEEMYPPEIGDFVYISDHTYTASQIRKMEIVMMEALQFDLGKPLPLNFLRRNSKAAFVDAQTHALAKYVMELCVVEYKMAHIPPSMLAAAALAFSMRVLDPASTSLYDLWTPTLSHYTAYRVESLVSLLRQVADLVLVANKMLDGVGEVTSSKKKHQAVSKKYSNKKFMKISLIPQLRGDCVQIMAEDGEI